MTLTRRSFLKTASVAAGAGLVLGFNAQSAVASNGPAEFTPFIRISPEGKVTAIIKHYESGQGVVTGLSTLIAEELNMDVNDVVAEFAPADAAKYANLFFQSQATGGSTSLANSFMQYRTAGAAAREMLLAAAAQGWGVDASAVTLENGVLKAGQNQAPIADFVAAAAVLPVPEKPALKDPSQFSQIGNPKVGRLDNQAKITGQAEYAMDVHLDGQIVAVILRSPRFGGTIKSIDDSAAKEVKGFLRAAQLPTGAGAVVYAQNTWAAFQARDAIVAEWDFTNAENRSSDQIKSELLTAVRAEPEFVATGDLNQTSALLANSAQVIEQEFYFPFLAHAPMEPLTCTIAPTESGVILYDGCQAPTAGQMALAAVLQVPTEAVQVKTLFAGGSFGRRFTMAADYHVEAALAFALAGGKTPVKLVWSREDDITGGYYRPAVAHRVRMGLDASGNIVAWDHRIAGKPLFKGSPFEAMTVQNGVDQSLTEGTSDTLYSLPGYHVGVTDAKTPVTVNWWRSVGHSHTGHVMETMMDLAANAANADPLAYRLGYLQGGADDQARLAGVLQKVGEMANWGNAAQGRTQGIAVHKSFGSYVAEVVEISGTPDAVKIEKVYCAVDCGLAVNPDTVVAQMESGIGYGIGHAMRDQITLTGGVVDQTNFPDYEPLRMSDIGAIETAIMPSALPPSGVGEPGTPPAAPALGNAIARLGRRVTALPFAENGVGFV